MSITRKTLLVAGLLLLGLLTLALLVALRSTNNHPDTPLTSKRTARPAAAVAETPAPPTRPSRAARQPPPPSSGATSDPGSARPVRRPAPPVVPSPDQITAPPVIPSKILDEPDPERKAKLMRMHKLATARIRLSVLRQRRRLLRETLGKARDGGESEQRILRLEAELDQLDQAVDRAGVGLQQAEKAIE